MHGENSQLYSILFSSRDIYSAWTVPSPVPGTGGTHIHSFDKTLLSPYYVPHSVWATCDTERDKGAQALPLWGLHSLGREMRIRTVAGQLGKAVFQPQTENFSDLT